MTDLESGMQSLKAQVELWDNETIAFCPRDCKALLEQIEAQKKKIGLLMEYANHKRGCDYKVFHKTCNCGLEKALD